MRPRISIRGSVRPSVCPSVRYPFSKNPTNHLKSLTNHPQSFLDASSHLYKRVRPSVRPSVCYPYLKYSAYPSPITHQPPPIIFRCVLASLELRELPKQIDLAPIPPTSRIQFFSNWSFCIPLKKIIKFLLLLSMWFYLFISQTCL